MLTIDHRIRAAQGQLTSAFDPKRTLEAHEPQYRASTNSGMEEGLMKVTGSCLCNAVRFESSVRPRRVTHCHCSMCRRAIGTAVATFATFESSKVNWLGDPARYDSSEQGWRGFCTTCGSSVCFGYNPRPERIYITVGTLDDPNAYPAGFHDNRSSQIEWLHVDENLPDAPGGAPPSQAG